MGQNGCRPGDLAVAVWDANPGAMSGEVPKPLAATSPGGRLEDRHIPVADSHQARVNEGRTEERGPVIQRHIYVWTSILVWLHEIVKISALF